MLPAAIVEKGTITPLLNARAFTINGISHPANVLELWSPAELKKIGVYPLSRAAAPRQYYVEGTPTYKLSRLSGTVIESRTDSPMSLADVKLIKQAEIDAEFETAIQSMTSGYPQAERESWMTQEIEAQGYPKNPTPLLDGLASARGVPVADIVKRVLINAAAFKAASSAIIGKKQSRTDALNAAKTFAEAIRV